MLSSRRLALVRDLVRIVFRQRAEIIAENLFLRRQLALHQERKARRRRATPAAKLALVAWSRFFPWTRAPAIVRPSTFVRWHRAGFRLFWRWKSCGPGRPPLPKNLTQLMSFFAGVPDSTHSGSQQQQQSGECLQQRADELTAIGEALLWVLVQRPTQRRPDRLGEHWIYRMNRSGLVLHGRRDFAPILHSERMLPGQQFVRDHCQCELIGLRRGREVGSKCFRSDVPIERELVIPCHRAERLADAIASEFDSTVIAYPYKAWIE